MKCRACFGENLKPFVDLGLQPASNDYRAEADIQTIYRLRMVVCEDCGLGQLDLNVNPTTIFDDYMYFSSASPTWVADRKAFADRMVNELRLDEGSLVVDIGSNDGYLLKHFVDRGVQVLGYEPAGNVAEVARASGVPTKVAFWGPKIHAVNADLVNATNVLAHTPDMDGFIAGVAASLALGGVATFEFPLFTNLIKSNQLDTIYHEHYSYISIVALEPVLSRHGLRIWRIEELPTHGGSVRIFACKQDARWLEEDSVARVTASEVWAPDYDFESKARRVKWDLLAFLEEHRGERIVGYGAPAKATVLCNYAGLGADIIDYVVDDSPAKQGKFVPGTNIPIVPFSHLAEANPLPDHILVFAWNLLEPITGKLRRHYAGEPRRLPQLITAIPELTITNL